MAARRSGRWSGTPSLRSHVKYAGSRSSTNSTAFFLNFPKSKRHSSPSPFPAPAIPKLVFCSAVNATTAWPVSNLCRGPQRAQPLVA
eukprot:2291274-Alexandrium_andersonii.AAC.1